jgi:lantibiotic modifying enzyme
MAGSETVIVQEAVAQIAEVLRDHARTARDGTVYWCHPARSTDRTQAAPLGPHLFAGTLGCALFLAALARTWESNDHRELALQTLAPLRREIRSVVADPERAGRLRQPLGGLAGLGSLVYGLVRIGDLLEEPALGAEAHLVSALLTRDRIVSEESLDVMTGSAGALLALLALDLRRPEENLQGETPLALASLCARQILRRHPLLNAGDRGGDAVLPPFWRGFCHGTSGICVALLRLYARSGEPGLLTAVERIFAGERRREPAEAPNSWCKGAPGIALARIEALDLSADPRLRPEAESALAATAAPELAGSDDLCCGNAGRLETLVHAARKGVDAASLGQARELAGRVLERAESEGRFAQRLAPEYGLDLRFFPGLAGIGYALLRLLSPELPSPLVME